MPRSTVMWGLASLFEWAKLLFWPYTLPSKARLHPKGAYTELMVQGLPCETSKVLEKICISPISRKPSLGHAPPCGMWIDTKRPLCLIEAVSLGITMPLPKVGMAQPFAGVHQVDTARVRQLKLVRL